MRTVRTTLVLLLSILPVCTTASDQRADRQPTLFSQLAELTASDGTYTDQLGFSAAISGNTAVVGTPYAKIGSNRGEGAVYVFVKPANGWASMTETAKLTPSDGTANLLFGWSIAISGNTIVVGTDGNSGSGSVYVFVEPANGWTTMTETARLSVPGGGYFGYSVAISGNTVVCGAPALYVGSNFGQGAAFVFVKPTSGWVTTSRFNGELTASDGVVQDSLGCSVSISGNTAVAGALYAAGVELEEGAAYVFVRPSNGWVSMTQNAKLSASKGQYQDHLGQNITISGDSVAAGMANRNRLGAVYVFTKPANGWADMTETAEITAPSTGYAGFGAAVALSAHRLLAGNPLGDPENNFEGAVYVFVRPTTGWKTTSAFAVMLKASDGQAQNTFGRAVSISGGTILVGADGFYINQPGVAYVFAP